MNVNRRISLVVFSKNVRLHVVNIDFTKRCQLFMLLISYFLVILASDWKNLYAFLLQEVSINIHTKEASLMLCFWSFGTSEIQNLLSRTMLEMMLTCMVFFPVVCRGYLPLLHTYGVSIILRRCLSTRSQQCPSEGPEWRTSWYGHLRFFCVYDRMLTLLQYR